MNRRLSIASLCFVAMFFVTAMPLVAAAPLQNTLVPSYGLALGTDSPQPLTTESYVIESAHNYANNFDYTWTINKAGATQIRVHFTKIDVEKNYDYVYVYDYAGSQLHKLTGLYSSGGWSSYSYGDTIKVRLKTDSSVTKWGFKIDQIEYTLGGGGGNHVLTSGVPVTSSLSATGATETWTIVVDANAQSMYSVLTCGSADFDLYGRLGAAPTTSTYDWRGYTSGGEEVTFNAPGAGTWYIMVRSYSGTGSYTLTVTVTYGGGGGEGEKIGVFFWASDAGTQTVINEYKAILQSEGYTKFFEFKDTTNFANDFATVAAYEDSTDIIFFYLFGHGNNDGYHSYTAFRTGGYSIVYSNTFRSYLDGLDSTKVGLLISSCHSGDWADDMAGGGYLAMSSSDETHNSWAVSTLPGEEVFANYFWQYVQQGYSAVSAFNAAKALMPTSGTYVQNPKIVNECSYSFFA
ncbi:MAG: pre-peptidase C-terminal domain-containing protein [Candidatus Thorarchaeota archaeon]|nr:pre-peptidase C-terminal domain-containing protein [Candidatus Thorarchaeota archaeon]